MNNMNDVLMFAKAYKEFTASHPKFPMFLKAVKKDGLREGSIVTISVETPEGKKTETNLRLSEDDIKLLSMLKERA